MYLRGILICLLLIVLTANAPSPIYEQVKDHIDQVDHVVPEAIKVIVTATCYQATAQQCDSVYWITASGSKIDTKRANKHRWIAISRDLQDGFKMGDTVLVEGTWVYDGKWIVQDLMNARWEKKIDFLVTPDSYLNKWDNILLTRL